MATNQKKPNEKLRHQRELRGWSQKKVADLIDTSKEVVSIWECGERLPGKKFQEKLCMLFGKSAEELGFLGGSDSTSSSSPFTTDTQQSDDLQSLLPLFSHAVSQGIIGAVRELGEQDLNRLRRQLLEQALKGTGVAMFASHDLLLHAEIAERLTKALAKPSHIDEKTLLYLEKRIRNYWQDRNDVSLPIGDLLPYVLEDLQKVTMLLEGSLRPRVRTHLCSIAGITAMLIGELYYDMRRYSQARTYQEISMKAAKEAGNAALEAVAWGRNSFAWTYEGNPHEARNSIQQAHRLAWSVNSTTRAWLAAVEAEIHSNLGDREACLQALKEAALVEDQKHHQTDNYWIHFDQSLLAGYQGVSFLKLSNLGHNDLVQNAQTALQDALDLLDSSMQRRRPTLLIDLAGTYVQQKKIEQACGCATQAIDIAVHINSKVVLQRFLTLRSTLEPWNGTRYVQALDRSIASLLLPEKHQEQE